MILCTICMLNIASRKQYILISRSFITSLKRQYLLFQDRRQIIELRSQSTESIDNATRIIKKDVMSFQGRLRISQRFYYIPIINVLYISIRFLYGASKKC